LTPSSHPGRHQDVLSGAVHQAEEEGARRHVADQHVETRRTGIRRRRRLLRRACGDRRRRGVEHPLAVLEAFPPGGIHLAAQASLLVRKGLAGTEQEQETEQTGAGDEGRRHGVVRLGERGESSDRLKRRPWRSTLTVRWPMASTRAPATRSPTRRVWPLITARAPSWPRRMACRRSGAAAGAALPWTDAGAAAGGGRVGSAAHTGRARLSSKATSKDLDTQPPRMSTEGMQ